VHDEALSIHQPAAAPLRHDRRWGEARTSASKAPDRTYAIGRPKEGSHYDLPIALGLTAALGDMLAGYVMLGELSLHGTIAAVAGALPATISDGAWAATAVAR
jgi:hypothetical protein